MRRLNPIFFSLVCLLVINDGRAMAQATPPVSATGQIFAKIIPIFSASETSQMNFGRFSPGPQGGEIILTPESVLSTLGTVVRGSGTHNAASFYVTGDIDAAYSITLPAGPVMLTHMATAKTMLVTDWISVPAPGVGAGMLQGGFQIVYVGATLEVGTLNDNPVGAYTGSYAITFDFN